MEGQLQDGGGWEEQGRGEGGGGGVEEAKLSGQEGPEAKLESCERRWEMKGKERQIGSG